MAKKLTEAQYAAIALLSLPNKGGMNNAQIAEKVGVSERAIYRWKREDHFTKALKDEIVRNTLDDLPAIMKSVAPHIINDGNAALFRTLLQAHGMLSEKVEVTNGKEGADLDAMQAKINEIKARGKAED